MSGRDGLLPETRLGRAWDARNAGQAASPDAEVDPALTVVRHLHERDDAHGPDPVFVRDLRARFAQPSAALLTARLQAAAASAPPAPVVDLRPEHTEPDPVRPWWAWVEIAAAILVVAAIGAVLVGRDRVADFLTDDRHNVAIATPTASPPVVAPATPPTSASATPTLPTAVGAIPDVPMFAGGPQRTGVLPGPGPAATPAVRWTFAAGGAIAGAPAVVDGVLYVGSADGNLYALDAVTGQERWRFEAGAGIASSPAVVDGTVYVGVGDSTMNAFVLAVDAATGRERWRLDVEGPVVSAPLVADGAVYLGTNAGVLYAINAATGGERWQFAAGSTIWAAPSYADGTVFVGSWDTNLYAIDAATGTERWRFAAEGPIWAAPPVVDGVVYVAVQGDDMVQRPFRLFALDAADGTKRWQVDLPHSNTLAPLTAQNSVAVGGGGVLVMHAFILHAFDARAGTERWQASVPVPTSLFEQPVVSDGLVVLPGSKGALAGVDSAGGATRWQLTLGTADLSWPVIAGGMIYVGAADGVLYALGDGETPSATPSVKVPPNATPP
ncbi:MAG TPA: PQQ-binding-like beta-propeller repeat protein [Thermomicrobiales bacterium]